jgi:tRNA pseudouridine38-40 synthase
MSKFMAVVQYDGSDFEGFQVQLDRPTVQGTLEDALERVTGERIRVVGAGRTDTGVHARAQVLSFQADWKHTLAELQSAWNANLPASIVVRSLSVADEGFDARRSARSRIYRYTLDNQPVRSPLQDRYAWHVSAPLDERVMHAAVQQFVGRHDFSAFGTPPDRRGSAVRELLSARCWRELDWVIVELSAQAFLQGMVRRIVGALVMVGRGALSVPDFEQLLKARDKSQVKWKAAPHGLCLWSVEYER